MNARPTAAIDDEFATEFEREIAKEDDSASRALLAAGRPIHIRRADTPVGHVIRKHPNGREELVRIDLRDNPSRLWAV